MTTLDQAKKYLEVGLSVIPIRRVPDNIEESKKPDLATWKEFQRRLPTINKLREWFGNGHQRNIALVTGEVSGNIVALDFDRPGMYERWAATYPQIASITAIAKTGKGYHLLLRLTTPPPGNYAPAYFQGEPIGETRGEGGYIVVWPSVHGSGEQYIWLRPPWEEIAEVESLESVGITKKASLPLKIPSTVPPYSIHNNGSSAYAEAAFKGELKKLTSIAEGNRNNQLNASAFALGQLITVGHLDRFSVERALQDTALVIGLTEKEVRATITSGIEAGMKEPRKIPEREARNGHDPTLRFPEEDQAVEPNEPVTKTKDFSDLMAELADLKTSKVEIIQEWAWGIIDNAAQLSRSDYGRFKDALHKAGLTRAWLKTWNGTVWQCTEELRQQQKRESSRKTTSLSIRSESGFPYVVCNGRHLPEIVADSMGALRVKNRVDPFIFQRGNLLIRIRVDEKEQATTEPLNKYSLRGILARCADFVTVKMQGDELVQIPISPPMDIVNDILNLSEWESIPPLESIATAPIVAKDGTIDLQLGYQPKSRLYYLPQRGLEIGEINPTARNVEAATSLLLNDVLNDFPFVDHAAKANALALMLAPFVRPYIDGPTPNHIIDAPTEGTGKTLLAMAVTYPYMGTDSIPLMTECRDDEEWRKRITAKLLSAPTHILVDNISRRIDSAVLASALTSSLWDDRILGMSKSVSLPIKNLWITTGNNVTVNSEHARRAILIRIDARLEKPADREGFKHKHLLGWMKQNRNQIVTAILTLLNCWIKDGQPEGSAKMGSYIEYSKVMSGILESIGIEGFLANRDRLQERADTERAIWGPFVLMWYQTYGYAPVSSRQLFPLANYYDDPNKAGDGKNLLGEIIQGNNDQSRQTKLGVLLRQKSDKVFGGYRIIQHETLSSDTGKPQYRLASVEEIDF